MGKKHKKKNVKRVQVKNFLHDQDHNSFFERLSQENILSDGMLSEVDQTDLVNRLLEEKSIVPPIPLKDQHDPS